MQRSILTRRVNATLEQLLAQRVFRRLDLGRARVGRITHRILWHHNRISRFVLDFDAGAVIIPAVLPATPPLMRKLRCFLRPTPLGSLKESAAFDQEKGELRVFVRRGAVTLWTTVRNDAYEYCTEHLISLADGAIRSLLEQQFVHVGNETAPLEAQGSSGG